MFSSVDYLVYLYSSKLNRTPITKYDFILSSLSIECQSCNIGKQPHFRKFALM